MRFPRRVEWLEGRYAEVDGIPFRMPIRTRTSPAMFAAFSMDARKAAALLPDELHPVQRDGRGVLVVAVVNYLDTTIGRYVEFCIGFLVTHGRQPSGLVGSTVLRGRRGTGVYIYDLPVSSEISVKGGLGIWGMPKRHASLDFGITATSVTSQYDLDGQLVARIDIPRPRTALLPVRVTGVGWGATFRGLLTKSYIYARGRAGLHVRPKAAQLLLGDHPRAKPLHDLDIGPRALCSGFMPQFDGVLDDHVESWYVTATTPPGPPETGLRDVVDLSLNEDWLAAPDRAGTERAMAMRLGRDRP